MKSLEQIFLGITDAFFTVDRRWRMGFVNEAAARLDGFGQTASKNTAGESFWEIFPGATGTNFEFELRRAMDEQTTAQFEYFNAESNRRFEIRANPIEEGLAVFAFDVSERRNGGQTPAFSEVDEAGQNRISIANVPDKAAAFDNSEEKPVAELIDLKDRLAAELRAMNRLSEWSVELAATDSLAEVYEILLDAVIELLGADFGSIQIYDPAAGELTIVAQRHFEKDFLDFFRVVTVEDASAGARALNAGRRVVIDDVEKDSDYEPLRPIAAAAGYRSVQSTPMFTRDGEPLGIVSTHFRAPHRPSERDLRLLDLFVRLASETITRQRAEADSRESKSRFDIVKDGARVGFWFCDLPFDELIWDNRVKEHFWLAPEASVTIETFYERIHPEDRERTRQAIDESIADETQYDIEYRTVADDKREKWIRAVGRTFYNSEGNPIRFDGVTLDITERKEAEQALRESEARFRNMADNAPVMIWMTEPDGNCTYLSQSWYEFTGQTPETGLGFGWLAATHPDDAAEAEQIFRTANEKHEAFRLEYRLRRKDGEYRWAIDSAQSRFSETGEFLGYIGSVIDIAERKSLEQQITGQNEILEAVALGKPLDEILRLTLRTLEHQLPGARGSVLLANDDGTRLFTGAAESLPDEYNRAIDGITIGEQIGSCGTAAFRREPVVVTDTQAHPYWVDFKELAEKFDLRACWSQPIISPAGTLLGTFAAYFDEPREPRAEELAALRVAARVAGIAVESKRAEEKLRRSEQFNQDVLDSLPTHIAVVDETGTITAVNAAWKNFARDNGADWTMKSVGIGANYLNICQSAEGEDASDGKAICAGLTSILKGETSFFSHEYPCHSPTEQRWFLLTIAPLTGTGGAVVSHLNISARREAEEKLRESEEQFRTLAASIPQLAWMAEADGSIFWYNERWYDFTGTTPEEMQGWGWEKVHDPEILPSVIKRWRSSIETGSAFEMEFPIKRGSDGAFRWFLTRIVPLRDAEGRVVRWFGTNTDIEAMRQARQTAENASRLKDEFLATVSHEVRTPLNAILGWSQMLAAGKMKPEQVTRANETIYRNAKAQSQLIEDLLDVSRIITGKMKLEMQPIAFADVIRAAIDTVRPAMDAKSIRLETNLDETTDAIYGDANRLQQVVWNLITNAVKFTPNHGLITVTLENLNSHLRLTVKDEGRGIEREFLPFIFDRFRQEDATTTRKFGGLGLGLAIVRHLVEAHGGNVAAHSDGEGTGATFIVRLPIFWKHADEQSGDKAENLNKDRNDEFEDNDCPPEMRFRRVLLVDDERDTLAVMEAALEECQAEVRVAQSAAEAFEIVKEWKPEILVSDIAMPGEDGYSLIEKVRALAPAAGGAIPAIALTAYARPEDRARVLAAGFQKHLTKPIEPSQLLAALASLAD